METVIALNYPAHIGPHRSLAQTQLTSTGASREGANTARSACQPSISPISIHYALNSSSSRSCQ